MFVKGVFIEPAKEPDEGQATAGQPGIGKAIVEQILPALSNAAIGTFTGAFFPKPGSTNITTGNVTQGQGQGQTTTQMQGQGKAQ